EGDARKLGNGFLQYLKWFPLSSGRRVDTPVIFPLGRGRLATKPLATASPAPASMTIGIVLVASLAARISLEPPVTMTSTFRRTNSAASTGRRSIFPS